MLFLSSSALIEFFFGGVKILHESFALKRQDSSQPVMVFSCYCEIYGSDGDKVLILCSDPTGTTH